MLLSLSQMANTQLFKNVISSRDSCGYTVPAGGAHTMLLYSLVL